MSDTVFTEKRVHILRGLPGAGKSTAAAKIVEGIPHQYWRIHNADAKHYKWVKCGDGANSVSRYLYVFDGKATPARHNETFDEYCKSVDAEIPLIVVDNTNTTVAEYKRYFDYAQDHGYAISIETIGDTSEAFIRECIGRNIHGVPAMAIRAMAKRFEETPTEGC